MALIQGYNGLGRETTAWDRDDCHHLVQATFSRAGANWAGQEQGKDRVSEDICFLTHCSCNQLIATVTIATVTIATPIATPPLYSHYLL